MGEMSSSISIISSVSVRWRCVGVMVSCLEIVLCRVCVTCDGNFFFFRSVCVYVRV